MQKIHDLSNSINTAAPNRRLRAFGFFEWILVACGLHLSPRFKKSRRLVVCGSACLNDKVFFFHFGQHMALDVHFPRAILDGNVRLITRKRVYSTHAVVVVTQTAHPSVLSLILG